ncbi:hypothetical protein LRD69_17210 [Streptomyces sp. JH14]|uniref:hypothetical protein n=1 Tax=Streptomyces sp. JH14 TaxID=2793630 RepID=UPI0023F7A11F|nr:hypothetical protein [Streptomyces sp. JH14]MDF6043836.1 hypothetical protein [Streptomyces sp. JH14]
MTSYPAVRCGRALVVVEGPGRLLTRRTGPASWTVDGVWPPAAEAVEVADRIGAGDPLLVVLGHGAGQLPFFAEELDGIPPRVRAEQGPDGLTDLRVEALDWLPAALCARGERFLAGARSTIGRTPKALLPPVLMDEGDSAHPQVRFAFLTRAVALEERDLERIVAYIFPDGQPATRPQQTGLRERAL